MSHLMVGLPEPRNPPNSQANIGLDKRLSRQLKTYGREDPPSKGDRATPLTIVYSIVSATVSSSNQKTRHISDMVVLGFYFCLRSCK